MWKITMEREAREEEEARQRAAAGPTLKLPDGFKPLDKGRVPADLPPSNMWYYNDKRLVFWNGRTAKSYIFDSTSQSHKELYEGLTQELNVAVGACFHEKALQVKHVLVNDLPKAAMALRMSIDHLDRPCALYALYEGHRGTAGNACAEFCVKQLHTKLLPKLAAYRGYWEEDRLKAAMCETFEELDSEFSEKHKSSTEGCSAAVALITGKRLVIASLGDVAGVVCMRNGEVIEQIKGHAVKDPDEDDSDEDSDAAPESEVSQGPPPPIRWTRAFGDLDFKRPDASPLLTAKPDVAVVNLDNTHRGFAFVCRALYNAIGKNVAVATVFRRSAGRPRMASGALVDAAVQWLGQVGDLGLGSIVVDFDGLER